MPGNNKISQNRNMIDSIDSKVLALLNRRAEHSLKIREIKKENGIEIHDKAREEEIIKQLCEQNKGPLKDKDVENLYKDILKTMREL